jgi:hypothetical protein
MNASFPSGSRVGLQRLRQKNAVMGYESMIVAATILTFVIKNCFDL